MPTATTRRGRHAGTGRRASQRRRTTMPSSSRKRCSGRQSQCSRRPVPAWRPRRVVAVGIAAYAVLFSFVTVTRHLTFATHALDLGYYVQLTWNLARGAGPRVSLPEMHAWGDHLSPIMYLFVPAFWLAPGAVSYTHL